MCVCVCVCICVFFCFYLYTQFTYVSAPFMEVQINKINISK